MLHPHHPGTHRRGGVLRQAGERPGQGIYLSQHAEDSGADALLHVTPYYNKASQTGLIKHYEYIADRTQLPVVLYNVPSRTGVSFTAETYKVLSQHPNINGVKEASGNFSLLAHTRAICGEDFYVWSGNDDQVVPMMSLGAKGVISVVANIAPEIMVQMTHLCLEGKFFEASDLQLKYMDFIDALFLEVNPIPIKAAMNLADQFYREQEAGENLRLQIKEGLDENARYRDPASGLVYTGGALMHSGLNLSLLNLRDREAVMIKLERID